MYQINLRGKIKLLTQNYYEYILQIPLKEKEPPRKILDRALTVFKLFKDQLVLADYIFSETCLIDRLPHYVYWEYEARKDPIFHLSLEEENEFHNFWKEFIEVNPGNFSVYRFHLADYRPYLRDRLVDYVESLEVLFVPDSDEGEIAKKFRSRGSSILGLEKEEKERKTLFEELMKSYSL